MSSELTLNVSGVYEDADGVTASLEVSNLIRTLTTKKPLKTKQTVGIAEEALVLGDIVTRGWCILVNRDVTNYVNVKVATGGAIFAQLFPGEFCALRLGSGAQSPFVIAAVAECEIEILLCAV